MKKAKPQKHRSRILNLLFLAALIWAAFTLSATSQLPPFAKMFAAYISWGMMIYLLMGFFFANKPSGTIALLGGIAAFGAELGRFDLTSMADTASHMPLYMGMVMIVGLVCYSLGIGAGWILESLLKGFWKRILAKPTDIQLEHLV